MKNYTISFNRRNIYNFTRKVLVLTIIILFSNTIHSTPKIDKKKQLNLPFPTDEIPEETEKGQKTPRGIGFHSKGIL
jgi:hypothetical protein